MKAMAATPIAVKSGLRPSRPTRRSRNGTSISASPPRPKPKIEAGDTAEPIEIFLGARDIHHRKSLLCIRRHDCGGIRVHWRGIPRSRGKRAVAVAEKDVDVGADVLGSRDIRLAVAIQVSYGEGRAQHGVLACRSLEGAIGIAE